ncbi:protein PIN-LIKES 7-like [Phragmites australis]|uniref:protein PIN-LIKES 7-like n=1 Tax=Phragmites australis TaxID=29695 RepID=UPI002D77459D|nr:protein PIN-LIKES 7-like [Phragmites australis]XP_062194196.1 protein PIN-LIKES 7-like [Phragmites australis]
MGFLSLFLVASMPIIQVLLIGVIGAYLASGYSNVLTTSARRDMNKVIFTVFTPSLVFATLAKTVTLADVISWWFMPVNIAITFMVGGILGWIACNILKPPQHFRSLIIAFCSAGNLGNLLLIIVPAVCDEDANPFGEDRSICRSRGLSYSSLSMALGGLFIWTHTYSLMQKAGKLYHKMQSKSIQCPADINEENSVQDAEQAKEDGTAAYTDEEAPVSTSVKPGEQREQNEMEAPLLSCQSEVANKGFWTNLKDAVHQFIEELMAPPTISAIIGFVVGLVPWLKSLIIGDGAPLKVIQDSLQLMGNGTIPCITLILGGNLTQGLRKSALKRTVILTIVCIRFVILPLIGIAVVHAAYGVGFLPHDPLYRYVLMVQFALPPAMNIGTMAQLFDVGQEECSVIFLWTYLVAAIALTTWSTIFMSILS